MNKYFIFANKIISIFRILLSAFRSSLTAICSESKCTLVIYFLILVISVILALTSCNPSYRVTHHGYGVYSDTIRVIYNSGNHQEIYLPY